MNDGLEQRIAVPGGAGPPRVVEVGDPDGMSFDGEGAPTLYLVSSPSQLERIVPRLRALDDAALAGESPVSIAARLDRLAQRTRDAGELEQRRADVDPLTGLPQRLRCLEWFEVDDNAWSSGRNRALLLLDLDVFRRVNEAHGRAAGDGMLAAIAARLRAVARPGDLLFRFELEEFAAILERDTREEIVRDAEAMRQAVGATEYDHAGTRLGVTASGGLAFLRSSGFRYGALHQAETAMYMAKIVGRDTLVLHDDVRRLALESGATLELSDLSEQADAAKRRLVGMADRMNQRLLEAARREANVDALTKAHNRRYFDDRFERDIERSRRELRPLSLAFLDIDDFRVFNNKYGHPTGDLVLRRFAEIVKENIRDSDWLARYGGEEFCLVMPIAGDGAYQVAERIRRAVARDQMTSLDGRPITVTVSIGLVAFDPARDASPQLLVQRASKANRAAKDAGKNRVVAS